MATKIIKILKDDRFDDILEIFKKTPAQEVIFVLPRKQKALVGDEHFALLSQASIESSKNVLILSSDPEIVNLAVQYDFGILTNEKKESKVAKKKKTVVNEATLAVSDADEVEEIEEPKEEIEQEPESVEINSQSEDDLEESVESAPESEEPAAETESSSSAENAGWEIVGASANSDSDDDKDEQEDDIEDLEEDTQVIPEENAGPIRFQMEEEYDPEVQLAAAVRKPGKMLSDIVESPGSTKESAKVGISSKSERSLDVGVKKMRGMADGMDNIESVWRSQPGIRQNGKKVVPRRVSGKSWAFKLPGFGMGRKTVTFLGSGVVILFAVVLYLSTGSAEITVKPRVHTLDLSINRIKVSDEISSVDLELKNMPGQLFTVEKKVEEEFNSTGERDVAQKAKGKITVYNEYGTTPQVLIATTRFESEGGLTFRTLKTVTVPGTTVKNGEITPGKIEVEVIADKAGDTYNIKAGKFTVPAFKEKGDADRYKKFYGISEEPMKGGIVGKAKVVTDADYVNAKETISKKLYSEVEAELKSQASGLKILSLSQPTVKESSSSAQPDEATDTFKVSETAELEAIGFKESDLYSLIEMYISNINDLVILPEKLELEYKDVKFNSVDDTLEFTVSVKGPAYSRIDEEKIISDLVGKNEEEIKSYIKGREEITSAKVILSPFWVRRVPAGHEKIKFELQYD